MEECMRLRKSEVKNVVRAEEIGGSGSGEEGVGR